MHAPHFKCSLGHMWPLIIAYRIAPAPSASPWGFLAFTQPLGWAGPPPISAAVLRLAHCAFQWVCFGIWGSSVVRPFNPFIDSFCCFSHRCWYCAGDRGLSLLACIFRSEETPCHLNLLKIFAMVLILLSSCPLCFTWRFKKDAEITLSMYHYFP